MSSRASRGAQQTGMNEGDNKEQEEQGLRDQIEALALQLVVGWPEAAEESGPTGPAPASVKPALVRIREQAAAAGRPALAGMAGTLVQTVEEIEGQEVLDCRALAQALEAGISQLQQALQREESAAPPSEPGQTASEWPPAGSLAQDAELLADFLVESREHLSTIETQLLALEQNPENPEALHAVFRAFHTLKGLAGFLEFTAIREVSHETETALDMARNGELSITPGLIDAVLAAGDYIRRWLGQLEAVTQGRAAGRAEPNRAVVDRIRMLARGTAAPGGPPETPTAADGTPPEGEATGASVEPPGQGEAAPPTHSEPRASQQTVKVDTAKLDYMVDMVGEMVIAQSLLRHDPSLNSIHSPRLMRNLSQLSRITSEVQKTAMALRMVPVSHLFQRTARVVRDLSRKSGKQVDLRFSGEETELDRTIIEELADPLMHMVRNALDHGIEPPEERARQGKDPTGRLDLGAGHQAGQILIEVSDDGRGLDREKILRKARARGLAAAGDALSDSEVFQLIFEPGFSTAEQVTEISGRGVGMDVVRKQLQKLRGRVEIQSTPGRGTRFLLRLPLTLAIIEGLVVLVGEERYIAPLFSVREMLRVGPGSITEVPGEGETVLVRGRLLPLVRLYRRFGVRPRTEDPCEGLLIVVENGDKSYCLFVDDLIGKQEVVIKSLGEMMKNTPGIAGGAILGDGRVGLILDVEALFGAKADAGGPTDGGFRRR